MYYKNFGKEKISALGFGAMRLPVTGTNDIDEIQTFDMVDYAISHGVNYFDTAYPYHGGMSEIVMGKALKRYPRDSFYLATKFPGHQISSSYDPKAIFEEQLEKCGVDYFDFYLLHNVYENSIKVYMDKKWGILDYFLEQKRNGRIRHLGFSCHGGLDVLKNFIDWSNGAMEFCQIQLNYLDWTMQDAAAKYEFLTKRNIPVWVMEPVRGGRLASLDPETENKMRKLRPDDSIAAWAFRWLQRLDNVTVTLSGMSNMEQMKDNIKTYQSCNPLNEEELGIVSDASVKMHNSIPCTACRYCCDTCPQRLNIPMLLSVYNEILFAPVVNASMRIEALPEDKRPSACIKCGQCALHCPQKINIPELLANFDSALYKLPKWTDVSREREEAAKKLKIQRNPSSEQSK